MTRGTLIYIIQRLLLITFTAVAISSIVFIGEHALLRSDERLTHGLERCRSNISSG